MTEETAKNSVNNQDIATPEANSEVSSSQQSQSSEPEIGSKEYNFRQLEEKNKELARRLKDQEQLNKEIIGVFKAKEQPVQQEDVLPELSPGDLPEWQHVQQAAKKIARETFKELSAQQERARLPELTKQRLPDFDKVVTPDRIQKLEQENPALAQAFSLAADPFTATYSYLKALYREDPIRKDPVAMEEAQKILENSKKPISSNIIGRAGALKNANAFAKKSKDELYKEMMSAASRV